MKITDRKGRVWTVSRVRWEDAAEEDFRFWYERMTPEQRVDAVAQALVDSLKTRGQLGTPRLRRVHRRIKRA